MGATNFLGTLGFVAGGSANIMNGLIASCLSMIIAAIATYVLGGFEEETKTSATPEELPEFSEIIQI